MRTIARSGRLGLCLPTVFLALLLPSLMLSSTIGGHRTAAVETSALQKEPNSQPDASRGHANQAAPSVGQPATLADLAWLEGHWRGDWGPRFAEQVWTAPKADLMLGTFRLVEGNKTLLIEVFTLGQTANGIDLRFRHFTPDLAPWEKSDPTVLTLESFDANRFVFANPVNGEPKHAILTRIGQDTYVSRFEIVPSSGDMQVVEITYHRQKPPHT